MKMCRLWVLGALFPISIFAAPGEVITTDTHRFTEIRNEVYLAQTTERVFNSNALVIVNADDVVLVDSHVTPSKARDLIKSIKAITPNPISTLINSHHHWDHAGGNRALAAKYPNAKVYGGRDDVVAGCTHKLADGDELTVGSLPLRVLHAVVGVKGRRAGDTRTLLTDDWPHAGV